MNLQVIHVISQLYQFNPPADENIAIVMVPIYCKMSTVTTANTTLAFDKADLPLLCDKDRGVGICIQY